MDKLADAAIERLTKRSAPPRVLIEKTKTGWRFASPYAPEQAERWTALLADALGTRVGGVIDHFLEVFTTLCRDGRWDNKGRCWFPRQTDFDAVLAIVASLKPDNEAQAAHAAQLAALHISAMKLGEEANKRSWPEPRTVALLAKTTRAYGEGMERLARLQGTVKPKTVNQTIQVVYCDNRNVNLNGGVSSFGGQPHASALPQQYRGPAPAIPGCAALQSPCTDHGREVPVAGGQREARLQNAWWQRIWCAVRGR